MGFGDLPPIEQIDTYLDTAFKKARTNARAYNLKEFEKSQLDREKSLSLLKINTVSDYLQGKFSALIAAYPNFENLSEFYTQLLRLTLDYRQVKKTLGALHWAQGQLKTFSRDFARKIKRTAQPATVQNLLRQYYGRVGSVLRQIKKELAYLRQARLVMRTYPSIKEDLFTVAIAGFPNVGKSTLLSQLTPARPEIQNYAFTTKKINQGYREINARKMQFLDTPGTLNRLEKMNMVEKVAYLAMRYAADEIVYVFDITEDSYSLHDQQKLLEAIKRYHKPISCYLAKTDLLTDAQIDGFQTLFSQKKIPLYTNKEELIAALEAKVR
ncbi:MAG: GTPase [Candidatus Nanoarchaeia archaeon]